MIGYLFALASSIFFSLYIVPRKLSKLSPMIFSFFMSVGFFISSVALLIIQLFMQFNEKSSPVLFFTVLAGLIWATSIVLFVSSIDKIGLSRSNQWKNLQGPIGVFLSLIILKEFTKTNPFFALIAALSIFCSAVFFTISDKNKDKDRHKGIYLALLSAVGFGVVSIIQKYVTTTVGIYLQQVIWSLSILVSLLIFIMLFKKIGQLIQTAKKEIFLGLGAGLLYFGASLFQLLSYNFLVNSISFTIIQMNALWTIGIGILIFKEIDLKKYYRNVLLGLFFTLFGIIFLLLAKK